MRDNCEREGGEEEREYISGWPADCISLAGVPRTDGDERCEQQESKRDVDGR